MLRWYVVNTKPKKESQVERLFAEAGFTVYCPKSVHEKRTGPFFPGYAFLRFEFPEQYQLVKFTRGVKRVVGRDEGPTPIPDEVVQGIRDRERDGVIVIERYGEEPGPGDEIEVVEGPLKGLRGIFRKETGASERVMILLNYVSYQGQLLIEKDKLKKA
ncbi:MAG: hypothetical protein KA243_11115 [Candidatus Aminicenantes bacterium]|nr:hypothetical protein [Candidatus Aminicenantes bacterium]NLH75467.1 hypothetical protein [Acidobacteriota bacterium]